MPSVLELLSTRRYRIGRNAIEVGGFETSPDPSLDRFTHHSRRYHHQSSRRHRHDLDGCDPLQRSPNQITRPTFVEHETVRLDQRRGSDSSQWQSVPGNVRSENFTNVLNGESISGRDRLPGDVLLARERLLERLNAVSISGNRRRRRATSGILEDEFTSRGNISVSEDRRLGGAGLSTSNNSHTSPLEASQETRYHPPGLTQDGLNRLHVVVFTNAEKGEKGVISKASHECSICLENFIEGAELTCLPCGHRFHSNCLNPWVRTSGDCPYCRAAIIGTNHRAAK